MISITIESLISFHYDTNHSSVSAVAFLFVYCLYKLFVSFCDVKYELSVVFFSMDNYVLLWSIIILSSIHKFAKTKYIQSVKKILILLLILILDDIIKIKMYLYDERHCWQKQIKFVLNNKICSEQENDFILSYIGSNGIVWSQWKHSTEFSHYFYHSARARVCVWGGRERERERCTQDDLLEKTILYILCKDITVYTGISSKVPSVVEKLP